MSLSSYRRACNGLCTGPVRALSVFARSARTPHWLAWHATEQATHVRDRSRRVHRHRAGQGPDLPRSSGRRPRAVERDARSACGAPERRRSWATCSSRAGGRTKRRPTGSFIFRRTRRLHARLTRKRVDSLARARVLMDANLLDAVASGTTRRIVYVADANWYGARGERSITEDETPRPSGCGRWLAPALDRLDGYVVAGLPIVTAFPGCVYGNGSWFRKRVVEPIMAGRRVVQFGTDRAVGVAHSRPRLCASTRASRRARRTWQPVFPRQRRSDSGCTSSRRRSPGWRIIHCACGVCRRPARLVIGSALTGSIQTDAVFSNIRLRGIGFRFRYPTLERGLEQVLGALDD